MWNLQREALGIPSLSELVGAVGHPTPTLGCGSFGRVRLVHPACGDGPPDTMYALKCVTKATVELMRQERNMVAERAALIALRRCPFVMQLVATFQDPCRVYFLTELLPGGELARLVVEVGGIGLLRRQRRLALQAIHAQGFVYRDLKTEDLVLDARGYVKVIDFGFAKHLAASEQTFTICGTAQYMAPEVGRMEGTDRAADYWSLGVLVYELLTACTPFSSWRLAASRCRASGSCPTTWRTS